MTFLEDDLAKCVVPKRHQDGGQIAQELVKRRGLRVDRLVVMRAQPVEHGVAELVVHDVGGQTGEDGALVAVEPVKLQRLAGPVVIGVLAVPGVRHDDQPVALERPTDSAAKREAALEEIESVLHDRPDAELMILIKVFRFSIEDRLAVGRHITILVPVPDGRRRQHVVG